MAGTQKQEQTKRPSETSPHDTAPDPTSHGDGHKRDKGDGIKPKDADPDYGPPDPNDPQRSGT